MQIPKSGRSRDEIFTEVRERKTEDAKWYQGRTFSMIYPTRPDIDEVLHEANELYMFENALNPFKFPSLRTMEAEVVEMTAGILNAPDTAGGTMTSGGTESIIMATLVARQRALTERGVTEPELLAPVSAHPAFAKAAKYLGLKHVQVPLTDDYTADVGAAAELVNENTAMMMGSAPGYPHGVIDDIAALSEIAAERNIAFHTDSCVGGFVLPWLERLGHDIPAFDFRLPGVTSMSADVHKYGYCTKGASVTLQRDHEWLGHQIFLYGDWPGGLYGSPAMAGARPAAPICAAWAVLNYLGEDGYTELAQVLMDTTAKLRAAIEEIPELHVIGDPAASVLAFGSDSIDVFAVGDVMDDRGWHLDRENNPDALHAMISPAHAEVVDELIADLRDAVATHGASRGVEARYS